MPQGTTRKGEATRARIVAGAAEALLSLGIAEATLDDLRAPSGASKSQIFHYFPGGRDELLTAVARFEAARAVSALQLKMPPLTTWAAWAAWRHQVLGEYDRAGVACPLRVLVNDLAPATPGARLLVAEVLRRWHDHLVRGITEMRAKGEIRDTLDPDEAAAAIIAAVHGGAAISVVFPAGGYLAAALDTALAALGPGYRTALGPGEE
ncbi:TetR/AcrR family transcriptional regulator [Nonomuraea candida]|uniref:TetR/AcrR family transcriptional regulator n=1 Tax=Nonomuraea candida TaxID=359159 RepID=UPI0006938E38|nr:TetR family transcriptional regulator [Nonomuraea candida]